VKTFSYIYAVQNLNIRRVFTHCGNVFKVFSVNSISDKIAINLSLSVVQCKQKVKFTSQTLEQKLLKYEIEPGASQPLHCVSFATAAL